MVANLVYLALDSAAGQQHQFLISALDTLRELAALLNIQAKYPKQEVNDNAETSSEEDFESLWTKIP